MTAVCFVEWARRRSPPHRSETSGTTQTDQRGLETIKEGERKKADEERKLTTHEGRHRSLFRAHRLHATLQ